MTINLWDLAKSTLGSQVLSQLSNAIGESEPKTKSAVEILGPAILGGLMKKASTPDGAKAVFNEVSNFDTSILSNLGQALSGDKQKGLADMGLKMLPMLFGSNSESLLGSLAKAAGLGQGASKSLLSLLLPLLMGVIGKQVKTGGLDLKGLTDLLMGQKSFLAGKLPGNLSSDLGLNKLLDQGADLARAGSKAAAQAADAGSSIWKVAIPLALLALAAVVGWQLMSGKPAPQVAKPSPEDVARVASATGDSLTSQSAATAREVVSDAADKAGAAASQAIDSAATLAKQAAEAVAGANLPEFNLEALTPKLNNSFGDLTKAISAITDEASARSALPQIDELQKQLQGFGLDKVAPTNKVALMSVLKPLIEKLEEAVAACYKIPGVQGIVQPALEPLMRTLHGLSEAA